MNMNDVKCFVKVAECMSFSKAAESLFISQQAVSLHIKRLEEFYNVKLFERKPALKITEEGKILLEAANDISRREEILMNRLTSYKSEFRGEISIGLPANRSAVFASEFVPRFSELYPNMTVNLIEKHSSALPAAVKQNEIDLAIPFLSAGEVIDEQFLFNTMFLETEDVYLVVSDRILAEYFPNRYPECKKDFISGASLMDFANVPMFLRPSSSHLHREIVSLFEFKGVTPFIRVKTSLTNAHLSLCMQGLGVFFSPPMLLNHMYREQPHYFKDLNVFPIRELSGKRKTVLIYHKKKSLTQPLKDSIDIIIDNYRQHRMEMYNINSYR